MNNFSSPSRLASLLIPVVYVLGLFMLANFIYQYIIRDQYDNETITVEFHCPTVLSMKENYPSFVINECEKLDDEK